MISASEVLDEMIECVEMASDPERVAKRIAGLRARIAATRARFHSHPCEADIEVTIVDGEMRVVCTGAGGCGDVLAAAECAR